MRRGFTLLELVLVLTLLVLLAAISYPSIQAMYADMKLSAGADHLRGRWAICRTQAIEENRPYRFAVQPGTGKYKLAPDSPEFWGGASDQQATDQAGGAVVIEDVMPADIVFNLAPGGADSDGGGDYVPILLFEPDGSLPEDKYVRITLENARPIELRIRGLTGSVTVRRLAPGEV